MDKWYTFNLKAEMLDIPLTQEIEGFSFKKAGITGAYCYLIDSIMIFDEPF